MLGGIKLLFFFFGNSPKGFDLASDTWQRARSETHNIKGLVKKKKKKPDVTNYLV